MTVPLLNRELLEEVSILTKETSVPTGEVSILTKKVSILTKESEYFDKNFFPKKSFKNLKINNFFR